MKSEIISPTQVAKGDCLRTGLLMGVGLLFLTGCCYLSVPPSFWGDLAGKIFP